MGSEPFEHLDTSGLAPEHRRIVEISRDQFHLHGHGDAPVVWQGPVLTPAIPYGHRGTLPVTLRLAEDGMCYCNTSSNDSLLWCVSVCRPNTCQVKNAAFWISKINGSNEDAAFGRVHPFMAYFNNPRAVLVPYLGAGAILKGRKGARAFKDLLRSVGAEIT